MLMNKKKPFVQKVSIKKKKIVAALGTTAVNTRLSENGN